eukprot:533858-Prorocentrum_minimum.AAC.1
MPGGKDHRRTRPSSPAVATLACYQPTANLQTKRPITRLRIFSPFVTLALSGAHATHVTPPPSPCARQLSSARQLAVSQTAARPSAAPAAKCRPSGEKLTHTTPDPRPDAHASGRRASAKLAASHTRRVPSADPETRCVPSGAQSSAVTPPAWPLKVASAAPVSLSHSTTRPSSQPDAINRGLSAFETLSLFETETPPFSPSPFASFPFPLPPTDAEVSTGFGWKAAARTVAAWRALVSAWRHTRRTRVGLSQRSIAPRGARSPPRPASSSANVSHRSAAAAISAAPAASGC